MAEACGDHALAMVYLDAAGAKFAEYGAKLYIDEVLAKKSALQGEASADAPATMPP